MNVSFSDQIQARLNRTTSDSGCPSDEIIEDALAIYLDELARTRGLLDARFDDLESGKVELIDGEDAFRLLMEKAEKRTRRP